MSRSGILKIVAIALAAMLANPASAATVNVFNDTDITAASNSGATTPGLVGLRGTVWCSAACSVLNYVAGAFGFGNPGELFNGPTNSGTGSVATWVSGILPGTYTAADVSAGKFDNAANAVVYAANYMYVVLKIGNMPDYTIIRNDSGAPFSFSYTQYTAPQGAGAKGTLSNWVGLAPISPIPIPAGGVLLLSALGGMGLMSARRRRKATA